ncbi:MAG TPA: hypothetical protein VKF17_02940 [Isosphaeraceae bacterium]|nr:hypothetical protein [Isosphaeraceae bacterium]
MWFARNGHVALLIDTLQLGEVAGVHHGTYNNVLRVLDVRGALGLLAPRPPTLIGAKGDARSLTRALSERAGAAAKLDCK